LNRLSSNFIDDHPSNASALLTPPAYNIREFQDIEAMLQKGYKMMQERDVATKALAQITSAATHDVSSPLMALKIALDQLRKHITPDLEQQYGRAQLSYDAIVKIVKEFRVASRELRSAATEKAQQKAVATISPVRVISIIDDALESKRLQFSDTNIQITKQTDKDAHDLTVGADADHLKRMLLNMIDNSVEAIIAAKKTGGEVVVALAREEEGVKIIVSDNGCGMSQEVVDLLGKKEIEGQGIGLYFAIRNIKAWGGDCKITSEVGLGTKVAIYLPIIAVDQRA